VSAKGAPQDRQDTVKTLRTIIWYKHACIKNKKKGKERDNFPLLSEPLKTEVNKNVVIERFLN